MKKHRIILFLFVLFVLFPRTTWNPTPTKTPGPSPTNIKRVEPVPTEDDLAWAEEHFNRNWTWISTNYPIEAVRQQFAHVIRRFETHEVVPNISILENSASQNVTCATDTEQMGRLRITLYLSTMRRLQKHSTKEAFQDAIIECLIHENIHLEEQVEFNDPNRRFTREDFARAEADAWCKTTARVLVPMRDMGRKRKNDAGVEKALSIYDQVGDDCGHALWLNFGREMSPINPEYNYLP